VSGVRIRREGRAGRITLDRPEALNALTWEMSLAIEAALADWRGDPGVEVLIFDGAGERAFCAGGDIAEIYRRGRAGDLTYARDFWRDEYRMNAGIAAYPKPTVAFLHGFTMGGGVGIGCHCACRVVGDGSRVAMPECAIGLVPDVGGSLLLARAPGRMGAYLGLTGARMGPGDAIAAGFADLYLPETDWPAAIETLCETARLPEGAPPPEAPIAARQDWIDRLFAPAPPAEIAARLAREDGEVAEKALGAIRAGSPLSLAATLLLLDQQRADPEIRAALTREFRFTYRSLEEGDFLEGIRAAIIDKDRRPRWRHALDEVTEAEARAMLAPLGAEELEWEDAA
jgi:enoyl-CoA hydratase